MEQSKALTALFSADPGATALALFLMLGACWTVVHFLKDQQIKNIESRLTRREEELNAFKIATGCETPQQAANKLLQATSADSSKSRSLSAIQQKAIARTISAAQITDPEFEIIYSTFGTEPSDFALMLAYAINGGGWKLEPDTMLGPRIGVRGLTLAVPDMEARSAAAVAVAEALHAAAVPFSWEKGSYPKDRLYVDPHA